MKLILLISSLLVLNFSFAQYGGKNKWTGPEMEGCYVTGGLQENSKVTLGILSTYNPGESYFSRHFIGPETFSGEAFTIGANFGLMFRLPRNFIASANISASRISYLSEYIDEEHNVGYVFDLEAGIGYALFGDSINAPLILKGVAGYTRGFGENGTAPVEDLVDTSGVWTGTYKIDKDYFNTAFYTGLEVMVTPLANSKINSKLLRQSFVEAGAHYNIFSNQEEINKRAITFGLTLGCKF
ncbi:hypothetical protein N9N67_02460 [Bacteriovoracaceae bacterium]|nr:hypothetical protein [Bacteriovoracaceae bacterium]